MELIVVDIENLRPYIGAAFINDDEIVLYYDKSQKVKTIEQAINNTFNKINIGYPISDGYGVELDGEKIGYFVKFDNLLVSFGINVNYRKKEYLSKFFDLIRMQFTGNFECLLYSYNSRAIGFIEKCGGRKIFENVSLFQFNHSLN
jgi:hypothetical protein